MRLVVLASLAVMLVAQNAAACGTPPGAKPGAVSLNRFLNADGWVIPGLEGSQPTADNPRDWSAMFDTDRQVNVTLFKPTERVTVDLQHFQLQADGKTLLIAGSTTQGVSSIRRFDIDGKVFMYRIESFGLGRSQPAMTGRVVPRSTKRQPKGSPGGVLGCGSTYLNYLDTDGDGKFETFYFHGEVVLVDQRKLAIPAWVISGAPTARWEPLPEPTLRPARSSSPGALDLPLWMGLRPGAPAPASCAPRNALAS